MNRLCFVGLLALSGCASAPSQPYRVPQVTIAGDVTEQAKLLIVQRCVQKGGSIEQNTPSQLVCAVPMGDSFGEMMYRAMATPNHSTRPDRKARYTFVNTGGQTFITMDAYIENQTAFGRVDRTAIRNNDIATSGQAWLNEIKSQVEGSGG
jgi:hypothetical protein